MKKMIFTSVLLAATYAFAGQPAPQPEPSIEGNWQLTARACSSNAQINDGLKIGQDTVTLLNKPDQSFEYQVTMGGCATKVVGTYSVEGKKITYKSTSSQSCKDANPVPLTETQSIFLAHLTDKEAVAVITGDKAQMSCPAGDALIMSYTKEVKP